MQQSDLDNKFRVHAVYVIVEDGRCAYAKAFSEIAPSPHLVSAMLTAMQVFIKEVTGSFFSEVTAGPFTFISEKAGPFSVVLVSSKSSKAIEKAKHLMLRFIRKYKSSIENWNGEIIDFKDFDEDVEIIFGFQNSLRVDPKKPLDAIGLIQLNNELQQIAKYIISKDEKTVEEIAQELILPKIEVDTKINELFNLGYLGRVNKENQVYYFAR